MENEKTSAETTASTEQAAATPCSPELKGEVNTVDTLSDNGHFEHQLITTKEDLTEETGQNTNQLISKASQLEGEANGDDSFDTAGTGTCTVSWSSHLFFWRVKTCKTRTERCKYQLTTCKKCDKDVLYGKQDYHSKNECEHRRIPCDFQFAGCEFESPEVSMPKHIQENMSKHLSLVTKHIRNNTSNHRSLATSWLPKLLLASLIVITFLLYTDIVRQLNDIRCTIDDTSEELGRKVKSSELAIESLQYDGKDIDSQLKDYFQKLKKLESEQLTMENLKSKITTEINRKLDDFIEWLKSFDTFKWLTSSSYEDLK